jgi:hypothetical protein
MKRGIGKPKFVLVATDILALTGFRGTFGIVLRLVSCLTYRFNNDAALFGNPLTGISIILL